MGATTVLRRRAFTDRDVAKHYAYSKSVEDLVRAAALAQAGLKRARQNDAQAKLELVQAKARLKKLKPLGQAQRAMLRRHRIELGLDPSTG